MISFKNSKCFFLHNNEQQQQKMIAIFHYKLVQLQNYVLTSTPEKALSGKRRIELCEKSKLRRGKSVVAYACEKP